MANENRSRSVSWLRCRRIHARACSAVGCAGRLPMRGMYGSSPNSTARWASSSANSRRTTQPWAGGVVGQDGSCAVMCRLSLWSASRAAPVADLASEARQSQRVSAPIRPTSPVNLGRRGLITLVQTFHCVFHLRVMSLARPLHRLVPDDRSNQDQGDRRCERTVPGARTGATGLCPTQDQRQRCARWWAGVCGRWMSADSRSWPPSTRRRPSTWGPARNCLTLSTL